MAVSAPKGRCLCLMPLAECVCDLEDDTPEETAAGPFLPSLTITRESE